MGATNRTIKHELRGEMVRKKNGCEGIENVLMKPQQYNRV
jgi:hypothetical protein